MIKIESSTTSPPAVAFVDPWIPLTVRWDVDPSATPLYLFVSDPNQGYVELKVHPDSGALLGFVVIDAPSETQRQVGQTGPSQSLESPVLDLSLWTWSENPDYREPRKRDIDAEIGLSQTVSADELSIWFSDEPVARFMEAGQARVGVSATGGLVVISVTDLAQGHA